jgi:hypothetical protein
MTDDELQALTKIAADPGKLVEEYGIPLSMLWRLERAELITGSGLVKHSVTGLVFVNHPGTLLLAEQKSKAQH